MSGNNSNSKNVERYSRALTPLWSLEEEMDKREKHFGRTELYSTGDKVMDEYLGGSYPGGYGCEEGYELVLIFGDTGCVSGEAEIPFKSDRIIGTKKIKLKNLYKRFNGIEYVGCRGNHQGENLMVRVYSEGGLPEWAVVDKVEDKGIKPVKEIVAGEYSLRATPDHRFLTPTGWKELKDISVGDEVIMASSLSLRISGKHQSKNHIVYTKSRPDGRHKTYVEGYEYHTNLEHRLAFEASMNGMTLDDYKKLLDNYDGRPLWCIPAGMEIHHKNGDHSDNRPENLEMLAKSDHAKKGVGQSLKNFNYSNVVVKVSSVTDCGVEHVYDVTCKDHHNFVANNFFVHNCNKSTLASSLIIEPAKQGKKIAYFSLEDHKADVGVRIRHQAGNFYEQVRKNIDFTADCSGYVLSDLIEFIDQLYDKYDIVVLDPIQFAFEASVVESGEAEYNRQRLFMRKLELITEKKGKTIILVSHTRKRSGNSKGQEEGLDRIIGSSGLAQGTTKVIEINRKDGVPGIRIWKNRFGKGVRPVGLPIKIWDNMRITAQYDYYDKDIITFREAWGEPQGFGAYHKQGK